MIIHMDEKVIYNASLIIIAINSDASYLSKTKSHIQAGGAIFGLGGANYNPLKYGPILTLETFSKT